MSGFHLSDKYCFPYSIHPSDTVGMGGCEGGEVVSRFFRGFEGGHLLPLKMVLPPP